MGRSRTASSGSANTSAAPSAVRAAALASAGRHSPGLSGRGPGGEHAVSRAGERGELPPEGVLEVDLRGGALASALRLHAVKNAA